MEAGDIAIAMIGDLEADGGGTADTGHGWEVSRIVYFHLSLQFLLAAAVVYIVIVLNPTLLFFTSHPAVVSVIVFFILCIVAIVSIKLSDQHPWNIFLVTLLNICFSLVSGFNCVYTKDMELEFVILTAAVTILFTVYAFWAGWTKHADVTFLKPFLCSIILVLLLLTIIQLFWPEGMLGNAWLFGASGKISHTALILNSIHFILSSLTTVMMVLNVQRPCEITCNCRDANSI